MDYYQYRAAYKQVEPTVREEEIKQAFEFGDFNKSGGLDWKEFERLTNMFNGLPDGMDGQKKLNWYWKTFATDSTLGMNQKEFYAGAMTENPDSDPKEIEKWWKKLDTDGSGMLSKDEFMKIHMKAAGGDDHGDAKKDKKEMQKWCQGTYDKDVIRKENMTYNWDTCGKDGDFDFYWKDYPIGRDDRGKGHMCYNLFYRAKKCDSKGTMTDEKIEAMFNWINLNGNDALEYDEFERSFKYDGGPKDDEGEALKWYQFMFTHNDKGMRPYEFQAAWKHKNGKNTKNSLRGRYGDDHDLDQLFAALDKNGDKRLDDGEFMSLPSHVGGK